MENKIPSKLSSKRFKLPWFNRELKLLCRKKARKYKKAKRSGREDHWEQYKEFQKVVQAKLTEGRWDYINRFLQIGLETGNKKPFWKYLRVQKQEDFGISALKSNSKMFTGRKSISEILNTQFKGECSVFKKNVLLWVKTIHYPNIIRSHLVTIVPMTPLTPKSTSKLRSALHIRYSKVIPRFISRANTAHS